MSKTNEDRGISSGGHGSGRQTGGREGETHSPNMEGIVSKGNPVDAKAERWRKRGNKYRRTTLSYETVVDETCGPGSGGGEQTGGEAVPGGLDYNNYMDKLKAPWRFKSFVRQALWKKLAVNSRLKQKGIGDADRCPS